MSSEVAARRGTGIHLAPLPNRAGPRARTVWVAGLALATGLAAAAAGASPSQIGTGRSGNPCKLDRPFWTPLHLLPSVPLGVRAVTVDGWFELVPPDPPPAPRLDRFFLRDDRGLGGRIALRPIPDFDRDFRELARTLMGRHMEVSGCLEGDAGPGGSRGILRFYAYAVIPEPKRDRPPREVELASLRDGAFGQRVLVRGVLAGRRHTALRLSTRLSDSDWVLASDGAAAWMRGRPPEGEGFRLDPDHAGDHGRGLAVVGAVAWWRGAPVIHVESVRMTGVARGRGTVAILFALPLDRRLDAAEPTIEVRFSAAIDEDTFDGRVDLVDADGKPVPARWVYDAERWSLLVSPRAAPAPGAELELRLRHGIVSAEGDGLRPDPEAPEGLLLVRRYRVSGP